MTRHVTITITELQARVLRNLMSGALLAATDYQERRAIMALRRQANKAMVELESQDEDEDSDEGR